MSSYSSDDDDGYQVRFQNRDQEPIRYINPRQGHMVIDRSRSRSRAGSRDRMRGKHRSRSPSIVIQKRIYDYSSDEDDQFRVALAHRRAHSRGRSGQMLTKEDLEFEQTMNELRELRLEARKQKDAQDVEAKKQYEAAQRDLAKYSDLKRETQRQRDADLQREAREVMELKQEVARRKKAEEEAEQREVTALREEAIKRKKAQLEQEQRELEKLIAFRKEAQRKQDEAEAAERKALTEAKRQLDEIKQKEAQKVEEDRLRQELEFKRMKQAESEALTKSEREKEIKTALEQYRVKEVERIAKEEKAREEANKETERRMQKTLLEAGVAENQITAILRGDKIPTNTTAIGPLVDNTKIITMPLVPARPTYTRIARRHVSFETLRAYSVDYDLDPTVSKPSGCPRTMILPSLTFPPLGFRVYPHQTLGART